MTLSHVLNFALSQCWALEESYHRKLFAILLRHEEGIRLSQEQIDAAIAAEHARLAAEAPERRMPRRGAEPVVQRGVSVIPIHGVIAHRAAALNQMSTNVGTSVEHIRRDLQAALADDQVHSILLDVDSPGGSVSGIDALASEIREARKSKPIIAHTEGMMASAAYYLASQADRVFATRGAAVGSIGVIASFLDDHRLLQGKGLDPVVVKSVPAKAGIQSNGTFSDADRADLQREVDAYHAQFVEAVAAGRGIPLDRAAAMGDGRVYTGTDAVERGFVDELRPMTAALKAARQAARAAAAVARVAVPAALGDDDDESTPAGNVAAGNQREGPEMDPKTKTTEETAAQKSATGAPAAAATNSDAAVEAQKAERKRVATILRVAANVQRELAMKLIDEGTPTEAALEQLGADARTRLEAKAVLPSAQTAPLANGNASDVAATGAQTGADDARVAAMPEGRAKWEAQFKADTKLQAEFGGDVELYVGFKTHEQNKAHAKASAV